MQVNADCQDFKFLRVSAKTCVPIEKFKNLLFLDRVYRIVRIQRNQVNLVDPARKVPPQAAKYRIVEITEDQALTGQF